MDIPIFKQKKIVVSDLQVQLIAPHKWEMSRIETQLSYDWAYFKAHPNRQKKFKLGWCLDIQDLSADKMAHSPIEMTV